ncbi:MAG: hypothetical protein DRJ10_10700, partial [Bacteroidetes bacterium]
MLNIIPSCKNDGNKMIEINKISILPKPQLLEIATDKFEFNKNTLILINNDFKEFAIVADYLSSYLKDVYQLDIKKTNKNINNEPVISLQINNKLENNEAYNLIINETGITIEGKTARAVF